MSSTHTYDAIINCTLDEISAFVPHAVREAIDAHEFVVVTVVDGAKNPTSPIKGRHVLYDFNADAPGPAPSMLQIRCDRYECMIQLVRYVLVGSPHCDEERQALLRVECDLLTRKVAELETGERLN